MNWLASESQPLQCWVSENIFYHLFYSNMGYIWNRITLFAAFLLEYGFECSPNTNTKRMSRIRKRIRISTRFEGQHLPIFFIGNLTIRNNVKTKILVHNRDSSLRTSHSSTFILIINHIIYKTINKCILNIYTQLSNK
jgi:hypothetical protein